MMDNTTDIIIKTAMPLAFPSLPSFKGTWQAIYLEPIIGSGERFCVAIAAKGDDGEYKVAQSIRSETLDCMYGSKSINIKNMIEWIIESAHHELSLADSLDYWDKPFNGVAIGKRINARSKDIDGLLNQAAKFSSSLSMESIFDMKLVDAKPSKTGMSSFDKWSESIKEFVSSSDSALTHCFNQKLNLKDSAYIKASYGFINDKYASNFGLLLPNKIADSIRAIKLRLIDIELLERIDTMFVPKKKDLIIWRPKESDPTVEDKEQEKIKENFKMLKDLAANDDIGIVDVYSPEEAGQYILDNAN